MEPFDDDEPKRDNGREMGIGLQIILGFFLIAAFCVFAWLSIGGR